MSDISSIFDSNFLYSSKISCKHISNACDIEKTGAKIVFVDENKKFLSDNFDKYKDIFTSSFSGKFKESKVIRLGSDANFSTIIFIGVGDIKNLTDPKMQELGATIFACIKSESLVELNILLTYTQDARQIYSLCLGLMLSSYQFIKYKKVEGFASSDIRFINCFVANDDIVNSVQESINIEGNALVKATSFARDCANTAPNHLYPKTYAQKIQDAFNTLCDPQVLEKVTIQVLEKKQMQDLNMGALLGVAQGSSKEPRMVIIHYKGGDKNEAPISYIGKGVTFDTGGLSLKPANYMVGMQYDMCGSSAVIGSVLSLALRKAKVNVVACVGLVENMPDADAQRPGDIVSSMSGKTIEVLNTDAEGRLVLADCMWYIHKNFSPKIMVDVATLTGAIVVALGHNYAGCFCEDETLLDNLQSSSKITGEKIWHMPLGEDFSEKLKSKLADIANIPPSDSGSAGSCTAAAFLSNFTGGTSWAHLDIAGTARNKTGKEGYGVLLLNELAKFYQKN